MKMRLVLLLIFVGCGGLLRPTKSTFYSLETIPPATAPTALAGSPFAIEGIELPPGIDRREIAVRGADQKLELRGTQQWASPLEDMVIHTLAFNLAKRVPEGMVGLPGQAKPAGTVRPVYIVFEDLAAGQDRVFVLDARVTIANVTRHERITESVASLDSGNIAEAMSRALGTLADRIAGIP